MSQKAAGIDRKIFGFSFSKIDAKSIATMICDPRSLGVGLIVTPNMDHIVNLRRNVEFANAYRWAAIIVCDGFPIQYYARLRGIQVERVTGCDIMNELMSIAGSGQRLFFIVDSDPTATALKEWGEVHHVAVETAVPHHGFEDKLASLNVCLIKLENIILRFWSWELGRPNQKYGCGVISVNCQTVGRFVLVRPYVLLSG